MMTYTSAAAHGKGARKVEKRRQELLKQIKESERNIRRMKPFQQNAKLRDSVAAYFNLSFHVLNENYAKILDMEEIAEQSYDLMEAYMLAKEMAEQKLDEAGDRVELQYREFAAANQIKLREDNSKLGEKIKISSKVNAYHKQLFLIYFKSYKDEGFFLDALARADVSAMEQYISALKASSTEGLSKLTSIPAFNGDGAVRTSCQDLLRFYQREATTDFPAFVDFELKKETLSKIQKAIEAKEPADRTQKEIDAMNAAINDYNKSASKTNAMGTQGNKTRATLINNWNIRTGQFFDKYTPTHR